MQDLECMRVDLAVWSGHVQPVQNEVAGFLSTWVSLPILIAAPAPH
jgi:hypothetical protein